MIRAAVLGLAILVFAANANAQQPIPRTAEGHPDLQGGWDGRILSPFERPADVDRLVLNADEAARMAKDMLKRRDNPKELDPNGANPDATQLARVGSEFRTSQIAMPPDGKLPYTASGRTLARKLGAEPPIDGPESRPAKERCISGAGEAPFFVTAGGAFHEIVQTPGYVVLHTESLSDTRIVRLDTPHDRARADSPLGDSIGRWEGDTLVVETTQDRPDHLSGVGALMRPSSKVIERFTLLAPDELRYQFTIEDPEIYATPWLAEYSLMRTRERLYEWACHEGNYGFGYLLAGGLAEQRAKAAKPKGRKR